MGRNKFRLSGSFLQPRDHTDVFEISIKAARPARHREDIELGRILDGVIGAKQHAFVRDQFLLGVRNDKNLELLFRDVVVDIERAGELGEKGVVE